MDSLPQVAPARIDDLELPSRPSIEESLVQAAQLEGAVYDAEGREIRERTLPAGKIVTFPSPLTEQVMYMRVKRRSVGGEAFAFGFRHVAVLSHNDAQGWQLLTIMSRESYRQLEEALI